ncbi:MAG: ScpA family protein [Velocimicrobium sp.]
MGIPVKLEVFEGPLDLLLHLIDKNKINIYDIPIVLITEQYLEYIETMESKDMDVMSEFLVMAATLVYIKSKMLLPRDEICEEEEEDPRRELVERLLQYKMFKYMSFELKDREVDAAKVLYNKPNIPLEIRNFREEVDVESLLSDLTLHKLHAVFQSVIKKQIDKIDPIRSKFGKIEKEDVNQEEKMLFVEAYAREHGIFHFGKLLLIQTSKMDIIVTFLSILELIKMGKLCIEQENLFDDILITYKMRENGGDFSGATD